MKSRFNIAVHIVCLLTINCVAGAASTPRQDARLRVESLSHLAVTASEYVEVNLEGPSLKPALELLHLQKPAVSVSIASLLSDLEAIYIRSFRFDEAGKYSQLDLGLIRTQLRGKGWSRIKRRLSNWDCDGLELYAYRVTSNTHGMAIICSDPSALTVVNILGSIKFERLEQLTALINRLKAK